MCRDDVELANLEKQQPCHPVSSAKKEQNDDKLLLKLEDLNNSVKYLSDLFQRRLYEDKGKNQLINKICDSLENTEAHFSGIMYESLFKELIVSVDRLISEKPSIELNKSIVEELIEVFKRHGLVTVPIQGQFDPRFHQIVGVVDASEVGANNGEIIRVVKPGYTFQQRLLRPAEVVIAKCRG